ncbi:phospho-N-acetylmuramoyl-pentapeptide-transferase [Caldanaerobacter subterraneus]|uniref:Phospho-N-acetylmuramoyl-pentapeptide-transferase n=1 Tax=Caldanaerobacter subterraneus TaxID=911092 RepID=A0A4R2KKA0_9THEO|nr:phospho-N-acetylmuramoyl-pentapeptide-transferase [Caldanaerobacter subterraneus]TCO66935.1 phospho-N-acetylmuramoyl-pentapeptide-transferase [Caldanaerobacter subterraneus]
MIQKIIFATLLSFTVAIISGRFFIPYLRKLKFSQKVREDGPKTHLKKSGTPTMGGIIFVVATFLTSLIFSPWNKYLFILLAGFLGYGLIGFADDFLKVYFKRSLGLRAREKLLAQFLLAIVISWFIKSNVGTEIIVPFFKRSVDLANFYIPFAVFIIVGTVNSVNLTDGLDGLAAGVSTIVMAFFAMIALFLNDVTYGVFSASLTGGLLGFLRYNKHPAEVFMGDTGSLAIGGAVATVALLTKLPLILPVLGIIYVAEAISVILQVFSFKLFGKRIFKMSPLHHHFELSGWKEEKVVYSFWLVTLIALFVSFYSLS